MRITSAGKACSPRRSCATHTRDPSPRRDFPLFATALRHVSGEWVTYLYDSGGPCHLSGIRDEAVCLRCDVRRSSRPPSGGRQAVPSISPSTESESLNGRSEGGCRDLCLSRRPMLTCIRECAWTFEIGHRVSGRPASEIRRSGRGARFRERVVPEVHLGSALVAPCGQVGPRGAARPTHAVRIRCLHFMLTH